MDFCSYCRFKLQISSTTVLATHVGLYTEAMRAKYKLNDINIFTKCVWYYCFCIQDLPEEEEEEYHTDSEEENLEVEQLFQGMYSLEIFVTEIPKNYTVPVKMNTMLANENFQNTKVGFIL